MPRKTVLMHAALHSRTHGDLPCQCGTCMALRAFVSSSSEACALHAFCADQDHACCHVNQQRPPRALNASPVSRGTCMAPMAIRGSSSPSMCLWGSSGAESSTSSAVCFRSISAAFSAAARSPSAACRINNIYWTWLRCRCPCKAHAANHRGTQPRPEGPTFRMYRSLPCK